MSDIDDPKRDRVMEAGVLLVACLTAALVLQAGYYVAALGELFLGPLRLDVFFGDRLGLWTTRAVPLLVAIALGAALGVVLPVLKQGFKWEVVSTYWRARPAGTTALSLGELIVLSSTLLFLPVVATVAWTEGPIAVAMFVSLTVLFVVIVVRHRDFVDAGRGRRSTPFVVLALALACGISSALFSYAYTRSAADFQYAGPRWIRFVELVVYAPVVQEAVYRGGIQRALRASVGVTVAVLGSSMCFVLAHDGVWRYFFDRLVFSLLVGLVYEATGSLWAPVVGHCIANLFTWFEAGIKTHLLGSPYTALPPLLGICVPVITGGVLIMILLRRARSVTGDTTSTRSTPNALPSV